MHLSLAPRPSAPDQFDAIVRAARKEHLQLQLRAVSDDRGGFSVLVVSGARYAAGYRAGGSWPERFRSHLEEGLFG
jgi:hypothetical protein